MRANFVNHVIVAGLISLLVACSHDDGGGGGGASKTQSKALQKAIYSVDNGAENDIYVINEDGSGRTVLADSTEDERFYAFAPNGGVIYTVRITDSESDVYYVGIDGRNKALLAERVAIRNLGEIHGVSNRVLFTTYTPDNSNDIYSVKQDGSGLTPLAATANDESICGVSQDGRVIYTDSDMSFNGNAIMSIPASGGNPITLAGPGGFIICHHVTDDGIVIFSQDGDVLRTDSLGSEVIALADTADFDSFKGITSLGDILIEIMHAVDNGLYRVTLDGSLHNAPVKLAEYAYLNVQFNRITANDWLVYTIHDSGQAITNIYATNIYAIEKAPAEFPEPLGTSQVDPDGSYPVFERLLGVSADHRLIYMTWDGAYYDIYSVLLDGTEGPHELINVASPQERVRVWEIHGNDFVYEQGSHIYAMAADNSSEPVVLDDDDSSFVLEGAVTRSGRVIYDKAIDKQHIDVYSVKVDGGGKRSLAADPSQVERFEALN